MDNISVPREWFKYAERDLDSAKFLIKMYPVPIEIRHMKINNKSKVVMDIFHQARR